MAKSAVNRSGALYMQISASFLLNNEKYRISNDIFLRLSLRLLYSHLFSIHFQNKYCKSVVINTYLVNFQKLFQAQVEG